MGFGIGFQEIVLIGVMFLILFGPNKLPQMARDVGRFVNQARRAVDDFKDELTADPDEDDHRKDDDRKDKPRNKR